MKLLQGWALGRNFRQEVLYEVFPHFYILWRRFVTPFLFKTTTFEKFKHLRGQFFAHQGKCSFCPQLWQNLSDRSIAQPQRGQYVFDFDGFFGIFFLFFAFCM